ncbi:hypothetical protein [Roseomonas sp. AR75]|uniref:hypothetical protein n=1 Tax=Roseomonas sp. AR75 TaxID=2562311 RepID=UPI0010C08B4E|nr:hypothetical protein [Roseomonas sp. AR75]
MRAGIAGQTIHELGGTIIEGWRVSETPTALDYDPRAASTPVYRQANIKPLRLQLSAQHWASPDIEGRWCVRPGDVVLNKLAPVRAVFVSPAAKRHPGDGNTLIVRDLSRAAGAWVALCLNQAGYERLLFLESGVLDRVGLKALAALRVPPVPSEMDGLSARLRDALDAQALVGEAMHRVRTEANECTSAAPTTTRSLRSGVFFACDALTHETWLPTATALRAEQTSLAEDLGWVAIADLASWDDRARLADAPEQARSLRLRDVGDDLFVAPADDAKEELVPSRMLARPLVPGEVLLSTLGSSFRTAYVDDDVPQNTFPADGWVRVRFRETPAAWALLLSTDALRSHAARLVVGSVQQFVPPEALRSLRVPVPPREVRDRWQRAVERHHAQRRAQDRQWAALMSEMAALFDATHRPFAEAHPRTKEAIQ